VKPPIFFYSVEKLDLTYEYMKNTLVLRTV